MYLLAADQQLAYIQYKLGFLYMHLLRHLENCGCIYIYYTPSPFQPSAGVDQMALHMSVYLSVCPSADNAICIQ